MPKFKLIISLSFITIHLISAAGCAAAWFVAGAGTAATAVAVMQENEKKDNKENIK